MYVCVRERSRERERERERERGGREREREREREQVCVCVGNSILYGRGGDREVKDGGGRGERKDFQRELTFSLR